MTLDEALGLKVETESVDFKRSFDPSSLAEWCELVKDIVAIANSGGGFILVCLDDDGNPSRVPIPGKLDPADVDDKVFKYTAQHLPELSIEITKKDGEQVLALRVPGTRIPIVFTSPGTYPQADGKQGRAFSQGAVYFRHGAKSAPGTTEDLRSAFDRELSLRREEWLGNIRKVVEAPPGAVIQVGPAEYQSSLEGRGVRLVHDPNATSVPHWNPDDTHPYRQKELVTELNGRLAGVARVNQFDIQCLRRIHGIDQNPNFSYRSRHGSRQYSEACLDWMVSEFARDSAFFQSARSSCRARSVKP